MCGGDEPYSCTREKVELKQRNHKSKVVYTEKKRGKKEDHEEGRIGNV